MAEAHYTIYAPYWKKYLSVVYILHTTPSTNFILSLAKQANRAT